MASLLASRRKEQLPSTCDDGSQREVRGHRAADVEHLLAEPVSSREESTLCRIRWIESDATRSGS